MAGSRTISNAWPLCLWVWEEAKAHKQKPQANTRAGQLCKEIVWTTKPPTCQPSGRPHDGAKKLRSYKEMHCIIGIYSVLAGQQEKQHLSGNSLLWWEIYKPKNGTERTSCSCTVFTVYCFFFYYSLPNEGSFLMKPTTGHSDLARPNGHLLGWQHRYLNHCCKYLVLKSDLV